MTVNKLFSATQSTTLWQKMLVCIQTHMKYFSKEYTFLATTLCHGM